MNKTATTVGIVALVLGAIASYTYLESMGRLTPQWGLWIVPLITSAVGMMKSWQAADKATEGADAAHAAANGLQVRLHAAHHMANSALAELPPDQARKVVAEAETHPVPEPPGPGTLPPK